MKIHLLIILLFFGCCGFSQALEDDNRILNQFIVMLKPGVKPDDLTRQFPSLKLQSTLSKQMNIWLFSSGTNQANEFLASVRQSNLVKLAQFNHSIMRRSIIPNDPYFVQQWNMWDTGQVIGGIKGTRGADIDATDAWAINHNNLTVAGDTIVIAVVDVAFDLTHEDLNFFVNHHEIPGNGIDDDGNGYIDDYYGWNAYDSSGNVNEGGGDDHSMNCAGIAGAIGNNDTGVAGVCWGAQILRVAGASTTEATVVSAYDYVMVMRTLYNRTGGAKGAFIVSSSSSFGVGNYGANPADYPIWCAMYDSMGACGILSAVATADYAVNIDEVNDVPSGCPSNYKISVTNTDNKDQLSSAGYGPTKIDIGAPGTNIISTSTNNGYVYLSGTSQSVPHIAGAIAQLYAAACPQMISDCRQYPDSIARQVKRMILSGATQVSDLYHETVSNGRLNLYQAVKNLEEYNCNRCAGKVSINFTQPSCSYACNGSAVVTASGGSGFQYDWSNGISGTGNQQNLCPGFYSVTVTDGSGCQQVRNFSIFKPDSIVVSSISTIPADNGAPGNIIVTASAGNYQLQYSLDGINYTISHVLVFDTNKTYTVFIKSESGCIVEESVNITSGINDIIPPAILSVYPNPANSLLNISVNASNNGEANFIFYNTVGDMVLNETKQIISGLNTTSLNISSLAPGIYVMKMSSGQYSMLRKIVVVE